MRPLLLFLACLCLTGCFGALATPPNRDIIEHVATEHDALMYAVAVSKVTAGGSLARASGFSMGDPLNWWGVVFVDYANTLPGDRVNYFNKYGILTSHRAEARDQYGLRVSGDRWPWEIEWVTPKNYRSTVSLIVVWDK